VNLFDLLDDVPVGEMRVTLDYGKGKVTTFRTRPSDSCNGVADMVAKHVSENICVHANRLKDTPGWGRFVEAYN